MTPAWWSSSRLFIRGKDLPQEGERLHGGALVHPALQGDPMEVLHHHIGGAVCFEIIQHMDDVRDIAHRPSILASLRKLPIPRR